MIVLAIIAPVSGKVSEKKKYIFMIFFEWRNLKIMYVILQFKFLFLGGIKLPRIVIYSE